MYQRVGRIGGATGTIPGTIKRVANLITLSQITHSQVLE